MGPESCAERPCERRVRRLSQPSVHPLSRHARYVLVTCVTCYRTRFTISRQTTHLEVRDW